MSILKPSPSPQDAEARPTSGRLSVITAGSLGNVEARLGASGFDIVAVAETEHALIDAVSSDEPDAIVVDADLCESLEHVRDLAPDAVLIAVGDHTPAGALGRIERGVSGTVMAGLLHALVAEGVGGAVAWGLVPALRTGATLNAFQTLGGSLLSAKADLIREHLVNVFRNHTELVALATTVAVTASASLALTMSAPSVEDRPPRVALAAPTVEPPPQERAPRHPVPTVFSTPSVAHPGIEGDPGRQGPRGGESKDHGRHDDQGENGTHQGGNGSHQGANGIHQGANGSHQGANGNHQGANGNDRGQQGNDQGGDGDSQGGNDQGQQGNDQGGDGDSQGENGNDQGGNNDDQE